ncbi:hypothetical protein [Nocardia seriolae]|uniref:Secreted protein n=1 Tax=Nocardia seriolae TaxID=37332 RepID=A0ABC9Z495_9NOCA|nr:hypothetical protein [Nocardia seriolae]APB00182.1 hypothetical protein NS506_06145 [Nocardia seriolae]MTJ64858.1 hypothetical protein [Nocardia seriolae]MTJ76180.1 hypothetical protein [Nocardia seriolae]MTK50254.1 hypothetical protein [Nocardia seriolae]MTL15224.1 hypothetical protein [Nocardia seriolae]
MIHNTRRAGFVTIALAAVLVGVAGPATADTPSGSGTTGSSSMSSNIANTPLGTFWTTIVNNIGIAFGSSAPK